MSDIVTNLHMRTGNNWGTGIVISTEDGKILLGLRKDTKNWTTPGGKVDVGETALQGVIRETREECGLNLKKLGNLEFMGVLAEANGDKVWVNFLFCMRHLPMEIRESVVPQPTEFVTWEWVDVDQALDMELFPPCIETITRFRDLSRL